MTTPDLAGVAPAPTASFEGLMAHIAADLSRTAEETTLELPPIAPSAPPAPAAPAAGSGATRRSLPAGLAAAALAAGAWLAAVVAFAAGALRAGGAAPLVVAIAAPTAASVVLAWLVVRQRAERRIAARHLARVQSLLDSARGLTAQDSEVAIHQTLPVHVRSLVPADRIGIALFHRGRFAGRYDAAGLIDGLNDAATPLEEQVALQGRPVAVAPEAGSGDGSGDHQLALPIRSGESVVAVLVVARAGAFGQDEQEQLAVLCEHVGLALAKARLFGLVSTGKREWEGIFDALGEGLALIAADGSVRRANLALAALAAVPPQKAVERHHHELLPFLDADPGACVVCTTLRTGARTEHTLQRPGGVLFRLAVTPHPSGGAVLVATDLTLERRAFEAVRDAERRLAEAERLARIGRLTAGLTSEMTDPLMGILGMTSLLLDQTHDGEMVQMLEAIRREARRAAAVTRDLSRAGTEGEPLSPLAPSRLAAS